MHGGPRQLQAVGDLADAEPARAAGEDLQDARRAIDRLDRSRVWSDLGVLFDIVESASVV